MKKHSNDFFDRDNDKINVAQVALISVGIVAGIVGGITALTASLMASLWAFVPALIFALSYVAVDQKVKAHEAYPLTKEQHETYLAARKLSAESRIEGGFTPETIGALSSSQANGVTTLIKDLVYAEERNKSALDSTHKDMVAFLKRKYEQTELNTRELKELE